MAIDELAARTRAAGRLESDAWIAETTLAGEEALLVKPQSYMNLSGEPVSRLLAAKGGVPADLIVIVDDVALPLGRGPFGSSHVEHRVALGVEPHALESAGKEAAVPLP